MARGEDVVVIERRRDAALVQRACEKIAFTCLVPCLPPRSRTGLLGRDQDWREHVVVARCSNAASLTAPFWGACERWGEGKNKVITEKYIMA